LIFFLALAADERPSVFRPTRDFKGTAQNEGPPGARARADELGSCFAHRHGTLRFAVLTRCDTARCFTFRSTTSVRVKTVLTELEV
jgi:hypothetical protein